MFWVVQTGFDNDPSVVELRKNLIKLGVSHALVDIVPFSNGNEIEPHIPIQYKNKPNSVFVYGSISLSNVVHDLGFGGSYRNFTYKDIIKNWGDLCLNHDCIFTTLGDAYDSYWRWPFKNFFIRPEYDDKSFNGQLMTDHEFAVWSENLQNIWQSGDYTTLLSETPIVVSSIKPIEAEYRFIVVDRCIITGSMYKRGDRVTYSSEIDPAVETFANQVISTSYYSPDDMYCLDIAVSQGKPYVLEIGCVNNAGLYACDTQKFINAVENFK